MMFEFLCSTGMFFFQNRTRLQDEYSKQVNAVFQQWESDLEKTREQETKLTVRQPCSIYIMSYLQALAETCKRLLPNPKFALFSQFWQRSFPIIIKKHPKK